MTCEDDSGYNLGEINPIRYRGYYYDVETGYYYCQSRYYCPEWCRWISADVLMDTKQGVLGTNMYAYCNNNPINLRDSSGLASTQTQIVYIIIYVYETSSNALSVVNNANPEEISTAMLALPGAVGTALAGSGAFLATSMLAFAAVGGVMSFLDQQAKSRLEQINYNSAKKELEESMAVFYPALLNGTNEGITVNKSKLMNYVEALTYILDPNNKTPYVWTMEDKDAGNLALLAGLGAFPPFGGHELWTMIGNNANHYHVAYRTGGIHIFFGLKGVTFTGRGFNGGGSGRGFSGGGRTF